MKRVVIILSMSVLLAGCGETTKEEVTEEVKVELSEDMLFANLIELDQKLVNADGASINKKVAKQLNQEAKDFAEKYPEHPKVVDALELAAKTAESLEKYDEAIKLLHRMANEFEISENTPRYLYNKARILEERLGKKENAKAAYRELIQRFPEDPLSVSAQMYLDMNYMDMTDAELIEMLESKNQSAE